MRIFSYHVFFALTAFVAASLTTWQAARGDTTWQVSAEGSGNPYAPQPQSSLRQMLSIDWAKGTSLPQGFQDGGLGVVNNTLVTTGGFCSGQTDVPGKANKYPRGFLRNTWGINLSSTQNPWQVLPSFPGSARQGFVYASVNDQLFCWGGINYTAPYTYQNGYRLRKFSNTWIWDAAPDLPHGIVWSGTCALGSKIYVFGGGDYDGSGNGSFTTNTDCDGNVPRFGARMYCLDTNNLSAGWRELAQCPGTPRFTPAMTAVNGKLYVFGGATGNDNASANYCTVVDNWSYDPTTDSWQRIRDLPVASGNFPTGNLSVFDRYILLVSGYQYGQILTPDGSSQPVYGTPSKYSPGYDYYSDIWVYDTQKGEFGTANMLPLNTNVPVTTVNGNKIYMVGGETAGASDFRGVWLEGEPFGHHPDLFLTGTISVVPEPSTLVMLAMLSIGAFLRLACARWSCGGEN